MTSEREGFGDVLVEQHQGDCIQRINIPNARLVQAARQDWPSEKWYGYAGHLIISKRCAYHLCTRVNGYLISTVGAFYPRHDAEMETIGSGKDDFYETFVFECSGDDENGDPIINYSEIDSKRYAKSIDAENGHYEFLAKYRALPPAPKGGE